MQKLIRGLISVILAILIISIVISFVLNLTSDYDVADFDYPETTRQSKRVSQVRFAVPLSHIAGYNYFWKRMADSRGKDTQVNDSSAFTAVDSTFLSRNNLTHAEFEVAYSGLLDADMTLNREKLAKTVKYLKNLRLQGKEKVEVASVEFLSPFLGEVLAGLEINYAGVDSRVRQALSSQFEIADAILSVNTRQADGQPAAKNIVIQPGYVPPYDLKGRSRAGARALAIRRVARAIFDVWRDYEKNNPQSNFNLVLRNSYYSDNEQNVEAVKKGEMLILGEDVYDLREIRRDIGVLNRNYGRPIKNARERIFFAVDLSNLVGVWQSENTDLYKNREGQPLSSKDMIDAVLKQRRGLIRYDYAGRVIENPLLFIYASYNRSTETGENRNEQYLPYTRTTSEKRIFEQLNILKEVFEASAIGTGTNQGYVVLATPRRELFPLYHNAFKPALKVANAIADIFRQPSDAEREARNAAYYYRPFARKTWSTGYRSNLADRWEQEFSLSLVRNFLKARVK